VLVDSDFHEPILERITTWASYGISGGLTVSGMTSQELYWLFGIFLGSATYLTNLYFKIKSLQLQNEANKKEIDK